jgi:hypothetical protein
MAADSGSVRDGSPINAAETYGVTELWKSRLRSTLCDGDRPSPLRYRDREGSGRRHRPRGSSVKGVEALGR